VAAVVFLMVTGLVLVMDSKLSVTTKIYSCMKRCNVRVKPGREGRRGYVSYMCSPKGYGFSAILVINKFWS